MYRPGWYEGAMGFQNRCAAVVCLGLLGAAGAVGAPGCGASPEAEAPIPTPAAEPPPTEPAPAAPVATESATAEPTPASHATPDRELRSEWVVLARSPSWDWNSQVDCVDVDGDGRADPIFSAFSDGAVLTRWTPEGFEELWASERPNETQSVAWGDMDGDGVLELALAEREHRPNRLYRLVDGLPSLIWTAEETDDTKSLRWGDADGDGDLDLAAANVGDNRVYYSQDGRFVRSVTIPSDRETDSVAWIDFDGDGDLDLIEGNSGPQGSPDRLLRNDDNARFVPVAETSFAFGTNDLAPGDLDGDGVPEFAVAHSGGPEMVLGVRDAQLVTLWEAGDPVHNSTAVRWADVDGDGDLDLLATSSEGLAVYANADDRLDLHWLSGPLGLFQGLAVCDIDGDGHDEWVVSSDAGSNLVFGRPEIARSWARPVTDERAPDLAARYRAASPDAPDRDPAASFACPSEMVAVPGGDYVLGEADAKFLPEGAWQTLTIREGPFTLGDVCVARLPFPAIEGAPWPSDGLSARHLPALTAALARTGRRLCRVDELLLASAGPENWRVPHHPVGDDDTPNPCGDDVPSRRLGDRPACRSPWGVLDVPIRSSWATTPAPLRVTLTDRGVTLAPETTHLLYGGTARQDTGFPPTNFSVHPPAADEPPLHDGLRLCADPGARTEAEEAAWEALVADFRAAGGSFEGWLAGR